MENHLKVDNLTGQGIQQFRMLKGLSATQVATKIGVSEAVYADYEAGLKRASAAQLYDLAQVFEVYVAEFFNTEEPV